MRSYAFSVTQSSTPAEPSPWSSLRAARIGVRVTRDAANIDIPHLTIRGIAQYGCFFREVENVHVGIADNRISGGLGMRIDNHPGGNDWGHLWVLDGVFVADEGAEEPAFHQLPQLSSVDVAEVLQVARVRLLRFLQWRGAIAAEPPVEQLELLAESGEQEVSLCALAAAATSGQVPAGPELRRRHPITLRERGEVRVTGALLASDGGFTLHAATVAAAHDETGREALVRYALRPPLAQERLTRASDDLVRLTLKRPFSDGTFAIELDPLSLLCRLATTIPPPRFHTVRYSGVLASASKLRPLIVPAAAAAAGAETVETDAGKGGSRCSFCPWAELMKRVFQVDVDRCSQCGAPMKLRALVTEPASVRRYLRYLDEATDLPPRTPARDPPYFKSRVVRRKLAQQTGQVQLVA